MQSINTIENIQSALQAITVFADNAHDQQMRKYTPERYIVHPVRVMNMCMEYTDDVCILAAALLHDVLEDTPVTAEEIETYLVGKIGADNAKRTLKLVEELTDEYVKDKYPALNRHARKMKEIERMVLISADAQTIKYADIIDNCSEIVAADKDFAKVFVYECRTKLQRLNKGDERLYRRAMQAIERCVLQLQY